MPALTGLRSMLSIPANWEKSTNGCGLGCVPYCASGVAAEAVDGEEITIDGQTATSPD